MKSRQAYDRVIGEWLANGRRLRRSQKSEILVNALILAFLKWVQQYHLSQDGSPGREQQDYRQQLNLLRTLYGYTRVCDFGPTEFKAVRESMIRAGLSRRVINQRMGWIRRAFRWGVENDLVSPEVFQRLLAVEGLRCGRTQAHVSSMLTTLYCKV